MSTSHCLPSLPRELHHMHACNGWNLYFNAVISSINASCSSVLPCELCQIVLMAPVTFSVKPSAAASATDVCNHHTPCTTCGYSGVTNSMKRRSHSSDHDFSSISLPVSLGTLANEDPCHVLRRYSSDPCNPSGAATRGGFPVTSFHSPEHANMAANPATLSSIRGSSSASGLPHQPPCLKRYISDSTPSPASSEETHSSKV